MSFGIYEDHFERQINNISRNDKKKVHIFPGKLVAGNNFSRYIYSEFQDGDTQDFIIRGSNFFFFSNK